MRFILVLLSLLFLLPVVSASSITLLAANEDSTMGSLATATLETTPGSGRVFIETNLLSTQDTQHSIRMAKQIICSDYVDCLNTDFYYTLQTNSPVITGPSAGAAIAILTFSHMNDLDIPTDFSLTGTINSGGFIGTVGGLKAKILAASTANLDTVYIPIGNRYFQDLNMSITRSGNVSINTTGNSSNNVSMNLSSIPKEDLVEYGNSLGISVVEAGSINEILVDLYEMDFPEVNTSIPSYYTELMSQVASGICNRANTIFEEYSNLSRAESLLNSSELALSVENYYSAASYCFGANIVLREQIFEEMNFSLAIDLTNAVLSRAEDSQKQTYSSINDIQIYAVVQERILDAKSALDDAVSRNDSSRLAYAYERAETAISWQTFYQAPGTGFVGGDDSLSQACSLTIKEAEQRIQYIKFYLPIPLDADETLVQAKDQEAFGDYPLCIFYSLQAKAQADTIGSVFGTSQDEIDRLLDVKFDIANRYVVSQTTDSHFPIIGYSYLEYGTSLRESDPYASLLYYQMAQELSAIDLFLESGGSSRSVTVPFSFSKEDLFLMGLVLGLLIAILLYRFPLKRKY